MLNPLHVKSSSRTLLFGLVAFLTACPAPDDALKPTVAITSPASDGMLTATTPIQIDATDNTGVSRVEVFARARGSKVTGFSLGSAVSKPYVISWDTSGIPNGDLELIAVAEDGAGNKGESNPVRVRVSNTNAPTLNYVVAYNLPKKPTGLAAMNTGTTIPTSLTSLHLERTQAPDAPPVQALETANVNPKPFLPAEENRTLALEWSWQAFQSVGSIAGVDGYSAWLSLTDQAGPYSRVVNQASSTAGTQKYSRDYADRQPGDAVFGAVKAINKNVETGFSNADGAVFPRALEANSPADGAMVSDGRPVLTWAALNGIGNPLEIGYLYFVYDKNPWDATAKLVWGNSPKAIGDLAATFPSDPKVLEPLKPGTYYWWVAGVSFDALSKADSFSFTEPRRFVVP